MRVLVTGGTGLVGRALVKRLVAAGHEVVCMARRLLQPATSAVTVVHGDLLQPEAISFAEAGAIDTVFHLGAMLPGEGVSDVAYMTANVAGTAAVVEAGLRQGASRFVYLSSVSVYGAPSGGIISRHRPPSARTAYAVSKLAGEWCIALAEKRGAITTTFRVSSVYGPGMRGATVLSRFLESAQRGAPFGWLGAGSRAQDFIHAGDVAEACMAALAAARSDQFLLASGTSTSMKALAELIASLVPGSGERRMGEHDPEDGRVWAYDIGPMREVLEVPPARSLADGLADLIAKGPQDPDHAAWWRPC